MSYQAIAARVITARAKQNTKWQQRGASSTHKIASYLQARASGGSGGPGKPRGASRRSTDGVRLFFGVFFDGLCHRLVFVLAVSLASPTRATQQQARRRVPGEANEGVTFCSLARVCWVSCALLLVFARVGDASVQRSEVFYTWSATPGTLLYGCTCILCCCV